MNKSTVRFYELDLLRFLAAMAVVLFHYLFRGPQSGFIPTSFNSLESFAQYGYLGISLFFMISGFVISLSAENRSVKQFIISRVTRLYPAFWAGVTITTLMVVFFGGTLFHVDLFQYLINLTMLAEFVGVDNVDGVYWTLYIELKFYAIICLVLLFKQFHKVELVLSAWLLILLLNMFFPLPYHGLVDLLFFPEWAPYFIAGVSFYALKVKGASFQRLAILCVAFLFSLRMAADGIGILNTMYNVDASPSVAVYLVALFYLTFTLVVFDKLLWFRSRWAINIGALTYPLYLIHQNLGYMVLNYFNGVVNDVVLLLFTILLMLIVAWLIHVLIEKRYGSSLKKYLETFLSMESSSPIKEPYR